VAGYLLAELKHIVYITDLNENREIEYWILHKALYGIMQAAPVWRNCLKKILNEANIQQYISDERCFVSRKGNAILLEYVDALGNAAPTDEELDKIEKTITKHIELEQRDMKDLLGIELTWDEDKLWLTQTQLIE
jgi:hypothetical protein